MRFEENIVGDVVVLKVIELRIAADISGSFKSALVDKVSHADRVIVLDMSAVSFIDSMGLGALVAALKSIQGDNDLVLCGATDTVLSMFKLTRMNKVFRMFDTADQAVAALSAASARAS
jgi:anti-sigma B factor antagonist